jgi:hypothetical protein
VSSFLFSLFFWKGNGREKGNRWGEDEVNEGMELLEGRNANKPWE